MHLIIHTMGAQIAGRKSLHFPSRGDTIGRAIRAMLGMVWIRRQASSSDHRLILWTGRSVGRAMAMMTWYYISSGGDEHERRLVGGGTPAPYFS